MAITIKVEPQEFQSGYNEIVYVLDSGNKAKSKFQYLVDVEVNGFNSGRLKIQSNPQGYGIVNISKHIESYLSSDLDTSTTDTFKKIPNSVALYEVKFTEQYVYQADFQSVTDNGGFCQYNYNNPHYFTVNEFITISGSSVSAYNGIQEVTNIVSANAVVTTKPFTATATGSSVISSGAASIVTDTETTATERTALNNVLNWVDVPNWDYTNYQISTNKGKFFTNLPSTFLTTLNDRFTFHFNNTADNLADRLKVRANNQSFYIDNPWVVLAGKDDRKFLSVSVGGYDIVNAVTNSGVNPINDLTESYEVSLVNNLGLETTETIKFNIDRRCKKHEAFRIMYLNRGGSFSTYNFDLAHSKDVKVKKKTFSQNYGSYDSVANSYGWNSYDVGTAVLDTEVTELFTINSDYVTEQVGDTIADLIQSPEVFHITDNEYLYSNQLQVSNVADDGGFVKITAPLAFLATPYSVGEVIFLEGFEDDRFSGVYTITAVTTSGSEQFLTINKFFATPVGALGTIKEKVLSKLGVRRAIDIKTSSVKLKQTKKDKLVNYSIKFEYATKNTPQR
jgi:hypothetical protein